MQTLSDNWFLEPVFDFEYKSYQVLGYAKKLDHHFSAWRFYPYIDDLSRHLQRLAGYISAKAALEEKLRRDISKIDLENNKIHKYPVSDPRGVISELEEIIRFAQKHFKLNLSEAEAALDSAKKEVEIQQLGISDISMDQGILFFRQPGCTRIYNYRLRMVCRPGTFNAYKDVKTSYVQSVSTGLFTNFTELKCQVLRQMKNTKRSNAFLIESHGKLPHYEFVLPVVKKHLLGLKA